jgi:hypothetical protein
MDNAEERGGAHRWSGEGHLVVDEMVVCCCCVSFPHLARIPSSLISHDTLQARGRRL